MLGAGGRRLPGRGALCRNILGKYRGYLGKYRRESTTEISGKTGRGSSTGGSTYLRKSATRSWGKYRGGGGGGASTVKCTGREVQVKYCGSKGDSANTGKNTGRPGRTGVS